MRSMGVLAAADPRELGQALGLVGQILDVGIWCDYARQQIADQQEDAPAADEAPLSEAPLSEAA